MASLTGNTIQSTYDSLLKVTDNDSITGSLKRITDGLGNNTPLYLSSSAVEIVSTLNVTSTITASNLSGTNTGDETKASIETKLGAATSSNSGYLTSTDWSTFNNKIAGTGTLNKLAKFSSSSSIADSTITDTGSAVTIGVATSITGSLTASSLIRTGGTSSQFLKADGSVDSTSYTPTSRTLTINGTTFDLSADRTWTIVAGVSSFNTRTGAITLTSGDVTTALGYTPYNSTNPNNYIALTALSATSPLLYNNTTGVFSIPQATSSINGFLSATDWTNFNNKLSAAILALNGLTSVSQSLQTGNSGTDFAISSAGSVHTFNIPTASGSARGLLSSSDWTSFNNKVSSQWTTSGSNIYYNTGNVGIGTTTPARLLHSSASYSAPTGGIDSNIQILASNTSGFSGIGLLSSNTASAFIHFGDTDSSTVGQIVYGHDDNRMQFNTNGAERMRITSAGRVGIGTATPSTQLHLNGAADIRMSNSANTSGFDIGLLGGNSDANAYIYQRASSNMIFGTANAERMRINTNGNVGIGNTIAESFDIFGRRLVVGDGSQTQGITVYSGTSSGGGLLFADGTSGSAPYRGFVTYNHSTDTLSLGAGGDARMRIDSGGFVSVGGSTTYNTSRVNIEVGTDQSGITTNVNSSDTRYHLYFRNTLSTVGSISTNTYATSFNTSSDYRLKEDLKPFNGLSILKDIKVYDFKWKGVEDRNYGVVAHEIAEVIPYAVNGEKDGEMHQSVDYSKLVPVLIQAIQEQQEQIEELKARLENAI